MKNLARDILLGITVADSIGAPVEFCPFDEINLKEVGLNYKNTPNRLHGFGTWNKPVGTFTDDSSMALCTAEYVVSESDNLNDLMRLFEKWRDKGYWTADGEMFDIGRTTNIAISNFQQTNDWKRSGLSKENDNGNGSLMRILPVLLPVLNMNKEKRKKYVTDVSATTHAHPISTTACVLYINFALDLFRHRNKFKAFECLKTNINDLDVNLSSKFSSIKSNDFFSNKELYFDPNGYVVGTFAISIYCLLTTTNYRSAVIESISFGGDTDTNAVVTGGLAAILYGYESIPDEWLNPLKRKNEIMALADELETKFNKSR